MNTHICFEHDDDDDEQDVEDEEIDNLHLVGHHMRLIPEKVTVATRLPSCHVKKCFMLKNLHMTWFIPESQNQFDLINFQCCWFH